MIIFNKQLQLQLTLLNVNNWQLYGIRYAYLIIIIFKYIYLAQTNITTSGWNGPGSNGNEEILYTPQILRTEASLSDAV